MSAVIGLTGGIGSGKSTVSRMFEKLGASVIDADAVVRELQSPGTALLAEIGAAFGAQVIGAGGELDRETLAAIVFRNDAARLRLNAIVHPRVAAELARRVAAAREAGSDVIVLDIPLLFEGKNSGEGTAARMPFDATVVVHVPESLQIERQLARDDCNREEAERRVRAQLPLDEKRRLADFTIDNSGTLEETERQVRDVFRAITEAAS
jgi:dephospho-CoA kinase